MKGTVEDLINSQDLKNIIMSIAKKFYNAEKYDLYQAGYIGAIKAYNNYKNNNIKFTTFAYKYIFGEMYELAKNNRNIKLNKNYFKIYKQIENAKILLTQKFNRVPSNKEVSDYLEIELSLLNDVINTCNITLSLDNLYESDNESNLYAFVGENVDYDTNILVRDSLECLNDDEKKVINYRYYYDYTQQEIANMLGVNQVKVSRLEASSKKKIKEYINA
mgnify:CR=1 FL=1